MLQGLTPAGSYRSSGSSNIFSKATKSTSNGYTIYSIAGIGYGTIDYSTPINFTVPKITIPPITLPKISVSTPKTNRATNSSSSEGQGIFSTFGSWIKKGWDYITNLGKGIISTAAKYLGFNERNGSYKKFTNGRTEAWCADFVTYVVKETFRLMGKAIPRGFGSASVSGLMAWGKQNGRWVQTAGKGNKASIIKQNVKPGDIIIFKNGGASHTGIVESIAADGTIHTIEGNTSDRVARRRYSPNKATITGFIKMA